MSDSLRPRFGMPRYLPLVSVSNGVGVHRLHCRSIAQPGAKVVDIETGFVDASQVLLAKLGTLCLPHVVPACGAQEIEHRTGERITRHELGEVGCRTRPHVLVWGCDGEGAVGPLQPVDLVASHALVEEDGFAFLGEGSFSWGLVRGLLVGNPLGEIFLGEGDGFHAHVGV